MSGVVSEGASVGLAVPGGTVRVFRLGRSIRASYCATGPARSGTAHPRDRLRQLRPQLRQGIAGFGKRSFELVEVRSVANELLQRPCAPDLDPGVSFGRCHL